MSSQQFLAETLRELMRKKPFSEISIADILNESGISRTTFYKYFYNKESLLEHLFYEEIVKKNFLDYSRPIAEREKEYLEFLLMDKQFYLHAFEVPSLNEQWYQQAYVSIMGYYSDMKTKLAQKDAAFVCHMAASAFVRINTKYLRGEIEGTPEEMGKRFDKAVRACIDAFVADESEF